MRALIGSPISIGTVEKLIVPNSSRTSPQLKPDFALSSPLFCQSLSNLERLRTCVVVTPRGSFAPVDGVGLYLLRAGPPSRRHGIGGLRSAWTSLRPLRCAIEATAEVCTLQINVVPDSIGHAVGRKRHPAREIGGPLQDV